MIYVLLSIGIVAFLLVVAAQQYSERKETTMSDYFQDLDV